MRRFLELTVFWFFSRAADNNFDNQAEEKLQTLISVIDRCLTVTVYGGGPSSISSATKFNVCDLLKNLTQMEKGKKKKLALLLLKTAKISNAFKFITKIRWR